MSPNNTSVEFLKLQEKYLLNFNSKLKLLDEYFIAKDYSSIANHFHKFKGNGLTYGFKPITDIAIIVDKHYKQKSPDFEKWARIGLALIKQILPLLQNKSQFNLNDFPEFQQLKDSMDQIQNKGIP